MKSLLDDSLKATDNTSKKKKAGVLLILVVSSSHTETKLQPFIHEANT